MMKVTRDTKIHRWITIGFIMLCTLASSLLFGLRAADSPSVLLQKGIYAEETEGDFDGAISIYRKIIQEDKANRLFIGQAQLRMGHCLAKTGRLNEAELAYRSIITEFPEQRELVEKAEEALRQMGADRQAPTVKTIVSGSSYTGGGLLSPDESMIAFVDWNQTPKMDVFVTDLKSSKTVAVTKHAYMDEKTQEFANFNYLNFGAGCWSPDSEWVAYIWFPANLDEETKVGQFQTRIGRANGAESKILDPKGHFQPHDWSPDGSELVGGLYIEGQKELALAWVSVETGEVLAQQKPLGHPRYSPDGRWIIGDYTTDSHSDIYVIDNDSKERYKITDYRTQETKPIFSSAGNHILFNSDRRGTFDLWALSFNNGHIKGEPILVKANFGDHTKKLTKYGNISYNSLMNNRKIITVDSRAMTSGNLPSISNVQHYNIGEHSFPSWLGNTGKIVTRLKFDLICIHDLKTKKEEIIPLESGEIRGSLDSSPDGKMVLYFNNGEFKVLRFSPRDIQSIPDHPDAVNGAGIVFSPDGKEIFRRLQNGRPGFVATNIDSGKHRIIKFSKISEKVSYLDLSPDGKKVAYVNENRSEIKLHDLESGFTEPLNLSNGLTDCIFSFVKWSPDSSRVAYYSYSDNAKLKCLGVFNQKNNDDYVLLKSEKIWGFWNRPPQWSPDGESFCLTMEEDQIMEISLLGKIGF